MENKKVEEIFKIQIPLATNVEPLAMIYNQDKSNMRLVHIGPEITKFMGDSPKKFAVGFFTEENFWIKEEAPWQDW